jgi:hypothetical protein
MQSLSNQSDKFGLMYKSEIILATENLKQQINLSNFIISDQFTFSELPSFS